MRALRIAGLLVVTHAAACDEPPRGVPLASIGDAYGEAYCDRVLACCAADDLAGRFGEPAFSDEAGCRARFGRVFANEYIADITNAEAAGRARYHPDRMAACFDRLRGLACAEFAVTLVLPPCTPAPIEGFVAPGGACDHDFQCAAGYCEGGGHTGGEGACRPLPTEGAACPDAICGEGLRCDGTRTPPVCVPRSPDGASCGSSFECASRACNGRDAMGNDGVCGPPVVCAGS